MPITIKKNLENCTDQEDNEVKLEVQMSKPSLELKWRKNNVALQPGNNVDIHVEETKHSLFFNKNSRTEQDYYCCETTDDKTQAKLTVEKHPICIVKPLRVKIALHKHKALLECQVSHANAKVRWYKDNKEIKANNKYDLISKDVYRQLYINEVEFSDEDTYTCDAIDEKTSCQLLVEEQVINIVQELRNVEVMEPSPAHFEAEISIKSENLPKWTLRGELLKANDDVEMEKMDNVYRLIFKNTNATMSGPLQFMIGKSKSVAQLTVFERPLSIVKPIKDTETKDNGSVILSCEFSSSPRMVRWFKGETLLESSRKYNMKQDMKSAELTIQDLQGNDSGEYHCQAGGCESKATLTVEVRRIMIIKHLKDTEVEEDTSAMFICELNYADVDVQWFLNKKRLWPSNVNKINHLNNTHSLTLKRLPSEDSVITIQAENTSESAFLKIKEKPAVFVKPLKNMVGEEEDSISLECEASKPLVFPIWKKDGVVLATSDKYEMLHFSRFIGLVIHDLKQEDRGDYCCEIGTDQTKSRVTVKDITIDFIKRLKTVEVKEGETCNFECVLSKHINDEYIWTLNGQPVVSDGRFQISNEKLRYKMSIKEVNISDSGDVVFTIRNLNSKTMLFVKEKPVMVYRDMQSLFVTPGEDAELSCEITKCNAKIKWLKNGKTLKNSPKYEFSQIGNLVKLVIHNAMIMDSGEYCCEVNGATSRAKLNVKDLEHTFSRELRDTKAEENGVAMLECETRKPALRIRWLKGMVILKPGSKYNIKQQGNILSLTIKGLEKSDSDIYTCDVGTTQSRAVLTVKERKVFFMEELEDKVCLEGDTIMFKCRICPSDYFNVRWYLDRTLLHTDHLNKIQILPGGYHTLTMRNVARKDSGIITLEAGGKRVYAFLLVREKRPTITKALQDCVAINGEMLVLSCKTSKACHILWYKDGCLIWNSSKYLARGLDNEATLTIYNVNEKDTGWYECHAGPVSTKAQVTVKSHHSIPEPIENIFDQGSESSVFATIIKEHLASWARETLPDTEHLGQFHHTAHHAPILVHNDAMHRRTITSLFEISGGEQSCSAELTLERQDNKFDETDTWDNLYQHRPEKDWTVEEYNELCPVLSDSRMISDTSNKVTKHQEQSRKLDCLVQLDTTLSLPHSEAEDSTFGLNSLPRQRLIKSTSCSHAQEGSHLSAYGVILNEITAQEQDYQHLRSSLSKQLNKPLLEYREDSADTEGRKGQRGGPSPCITMVKSISCDSRVKSPQSNIYKQHQLLSRSLGDFMSMVPDSTELRESGEKRKNVETFRTECIQYSLACKGSVMLQQSIPELLVAPTKHTSLAVPKDQHDHSITSVSSGSSSKFDKTDTWDTLYQDIPEKDWKEEEFNELCPVLSDSNVISDTSNKVTKHQEQSTKLGCLAQLDTTLSLPHSEAEDSTFGLNSLPRQRVIKSTSCSHAQEGSHLSAPGVILNEVAAQEQGYQHLRSSLSKQLNEPLLEYREDSADTEGRKGQRRGPSPCITMVKSISCDSGVKRPQSKVYKQHQLWSRSLDDFMSMVPDSTELRESGEQSKKVETFRTECIQYSLACKGSVMLQQSIPELLVAPTKNTSLAVPKDQHDHSITSVSSGSSSKFDKTDTWDTRYQDISEKDWKEEEFNELCPVLSDSKVISDTSNKVTKHREQSRKLGCLAQLDTTLSLPHSEAEDSTFGLNSLPRQRLIKSTSCSHAQEGSRQSAPGVILNEVAAQEQGYQHLSSSLSKQMNEPLLEYREDSADTEGRKGQRGGPSPCITMVKSISCDSGVKRPQSNVYKQHQLWSRSFDDFMSMVPDSTELRESGEKSKKVETFKTECIQYSLACKGSVMLQQSIPELLVAPTKHTSLAVPKDQHDHSITSVSSGSSSKFDKTDTWDTLYQDIPEKDWKEEEFNELCPVLSDSNVISDTSNKVTKHQEKSSKLGCLAQLDTTLSLPYSEAEDSTFGLNSLPRQRLIKSTSCSHAQEGSLLSAPGVILNEITAQEQGYQHLSSSLSKQLNEPLLEYREDSANTEGRKGQGGGPSPCITMVKSISCDSGVKRPQSNIYKQHQLWSRSLDDCMSIVPDSTELRESGEKNKRVETFRTECIQYSLASKGSVMLQQSIPELPVAPTKHTSLAVPKDQHDHSITSVSSGSSSKFDKTDTWDTLYLDIPEKDWKEEEFNELCPVLSDSNVISDTSNKVTKHQEQSRKLGCLAQLDTTLSLPHSEAEDSTFGLNSLPRQRLIKSTSFSHAQEGSLLSAPGVILNEVVAQEQGYQHLSSSLSKQLNEPLLEYREDSADTEGRKGQGGGPSPCITMVKSISCDSGVKSPQSNVYKQHQLWSRSLDDFMSMIPDSTELRESGEKSKKMNTFRTEAFIGGVPENVDTDPEKSVKAAVDTHIGRRTYSLAADEAVMIEMTRPLMVQSLSEEIKAMTHVIFAPGRHEELEYSSIPETTQAEYIFISNSIQPVKKDILQQNPLFTKSQLLIPRSLEQSDRPQNMDISLKPLETSQEILSLDPQNKEQGLFSLHNSINITNVGLKNSDKGNQVAVSFEDENPGLLEIKNKKRLEDRKLSIVEKSDSTHKISHISDFQENSETSQVCKMKTLSNFCHYGSQSALNTIPPSGKSRKSVPKKFFWRQSGTVKSSHKKGDEKLPGHNFPSTLQQQQKAEDLSISTKLMESMSRFSKLLSRKYSKEKGEGDKSKIASPLHKRMLPGIGDASSHKRAPSEFYKLPILKKKKDIHIPLTPVELAAVADTGSDRLAAYKTYRFLSEISRGRFSVVRQCQDDQSKQLFAAKIIPYKKEQQEQVLHEYQLLKKLDHTHIVQLHAAFITPCYLVLIEELCAGRELLHNLAERDLYAEMHVAELLQQILSAVDYLHSSYIVHLDLKSDNILVTDHNLLKIVDLGSAQTFTPGQTLSVEHILETKERKVNIVLPKAPEVLEREGVGPETDIWAIGVLVFIMLSGDDPFKSELHWESEDNIRKGKIQFGRCYPGLSEGSVSFMKRTLYYKPWGRPSAAECLQIPWVRGLHHSSRRCHSIVCFSTDKLQAYLGEQETKREKACTKMDVPLLN